MSVDDLLRRLFTQFGLHNLTQDSIGYRLAHGAVRAWRVTRARARRPRRCNLRILRPADIARLPRLDEIGHIVLIKGDHIGDLVVALPAIARLRQRCPNARISLVCNPLNAELARSFGLFDRIVAVPLDLRRGANSAVERASVIAALATLEPADIAIDMKIEAATRYVLGHVAARLRAGFHDGSAFWDQPDTLGLPTVLRNTNLHTGALLTMLVDAVIARLERDEAEAATRAILNGVGEPAPAEGKAERLVGIAVGAGTSVKLWPGAYFAELCRALQRQENVRIVLFGAEQDRARAAGIASELSPEMTCDMTGHLSLPEFVDAAKQLDLFIGLDTGTTHIAAGLGIASICIFPAVTLQSRWLPQGRDATVLLNDVSCRECDLRRGEDCPNGLVCMTGISPETVLREALRSLRRSPPTRPETPFR
jgi:ADP-heptose:LPS heptosyltransferase